MAYFADVDAAKQIIKRLYPEAKEIKFIEHGYDNLVGLVDSQFVLKFPRHENGYRRDRYEAIVLSAIAKIHELLIPKVLGSGDNPPYFITSFIDGVHISQQEINQQSAKQQKEFSEKIARFAFTMHSMLSSKQAIKNRKELGFDDRNDQPWVVYFEKILATKKFPTSKQDKLAKEFLKKWSNLKYTTPTVVVHDDLQTDNLMFEGSKLVGIIDFGDTIPGNPEQEFRQMYRINNFVLDTAVDTYEQLSGLLLNREAIKLWAILQELMVYYGELARKQTNDPKFIRASGNLQKWLPEGKWNSLLEHYHS